MLLHLGRFRWRPHPISMANSIKSVRWFRICYFWFVNLAPLSAHIHHNDSEHHYDHHNHPDPRLDDHQLITFSVFIAIAARRNWEHSKLWTHLSFGHLLGILDCSIQQQQHDQQKQQLQQ